MNTKKLLLLFAVIVLYLIILDFGFYVFYNPPEIFVEEQDLGFPPGLNIVPFEGKNFTFYVNSLGLRDEEVSIEKPEDEFRIIILGDSFTYGFGELANETYPSLLENRLKEINPNVNIINFGGNGHNTYSQLVTLKSKVPKFEPDLVILGYFLNDPDFSDSEEAMEYCESLKLRLDDSTPYYPFKSLNSYLEKTHIYFTHDQGSAYLFSLFEDSNLGWRCSKKFFYQFDDVIVFILPIFSDDIAYEQIYIDIENALDNARLENYNMHRNVKYDRNVLTSNDFKHYNLYANTLVADYMYEILKEKIKP